MNDTPTRARSLPQPIDAALVPRFAGIPTFMRLPAVTAPSEVDVALVGVPFDGGTTNRAGARHGPREIRSQSSLMRRVHHVSNVAPYDLVRVGDLGDCPINPIDLSDALAKIESFFAGIRAAGAIPITAGGDHLISLPILRALEFERFLDPGIAEIGDPAQRIGIDAGRLVDAPHQARLVADLTRPVAGAGAVGHAAVERHADEPDIDPGEVLAIGRPHEGRDAGIARPHHRIGKFRIG